MSQAKRIVMASLAALFTAVLILVLLVLPAEYGLDPLGTGKALGLMELSDGERGALSVQPSAWRQDEINFELIPFESVEYKYRLSAGAGMVYSWQANGEVLAEMHSEPDGAAPGYAETFSKQTVDGDHGTYTAPFDGIHGWYWQNRGSEDVTVTLKASGFFDTAIIMSSDRRDEREIGE
jgi:hypothetical protein